MANDVKDTKVCNRAIANYLQGNGNGFKTWTGKIHNEHFVQVQATTNSNEKFYRRQTSKSVAKTICVTFSQRR